MPTKSQARRKAAGDRVQDLPESDRGAHDAIGGTALREQIIDIILDVLSESAPVRPEVRAGLLKHLADNPGNPEKALLDHLRDPVTRSDATGGRRQARPKPVTR
ncbi:hypothetical protein [Arthrobacter sp. ISL-5]|uniref:hypothetical protein n=1 Tax=Arthrobacter sp. ISL-5 TaxID=2819111 RepID=UPI001BE5D8C2|nr:hypothetical protein [Arthrobacter sp. ISL-5]MBT2556061.1 hypothetical protein [Arthrobacter sp. ISL-5]